MILETNRSDQSGLEPRFPLAVKRKQGGTLKEHFFRNIAKLISIDLLVQCYLPHLFVMPYFSDPCPLSAPLTGHGASR